VLVKARCVGLSLSGQGIFMPVCAQCGKGYEATERVCPSCGASKEFSPARCGPVAMFAMRFAWVAAFIAAVICVLGGIVVVIRGEWLAGLVLIFIMAPIGYGQHVALGMAIDYAQGGR
jgi:hypothetical protein